MYFNINSLQGGQYFTQGYEFSGIAPRGEWVNLVEKVSDTKQRHSYVRFGSVNSLEDVEILTPNILVPTSDISVYFDAIDYLLDSSIEYLNINRPQNINDEIVVKEIPKINVSFNLNTCRTSFINMASSNHTYFDCDYTCSDDPNIRINYFIEDFREYRDPGNIKLMNENKNDVPFFGNLPISNDGNQTFSFLINSQIENLQTNQKSK